MTNSIRSKNVRRSSISMRTFWNGFYGTLNLLLVTISVLCITPRVETVSVPKIIFAFLPPPRFRDIHHTQRRVDCPASKKKSDWQKMMDEQFEKRLQKAAEARARDRGEELTMVVKPKPRYVRPEDMNSSSIDIDWENRVRFESQQYGNRFVQNEILRKNLGG